MVAKLKSLKVADLRDLLTKAGEPAPSKANKPDLIARVSASQAALAAYRAKYEAPAVQDEDELVDYTDDVEPVVASVPAQAPSAPTPAAAPPTAASAPAAPPPTKPTSASANGGSAPEAPPADSAAQIADPSPVSSEAPYDWRNDPAVQDNEGDSPELKARKARCRRFNVPLVDPNTSPQRRGRRGQGNKAAAATPAAAAAAKPQANVAPVAADTKPKSNPSGKSIGVVADDPKKLEARKKRFEQLLPGQKPPTAVENVAPKLNPSAPEFSPRGTKRPSEEVSSEEQAKRQRRQERFGVKKPAADSVAERPVQAA
ncbi:hypothetical protein HDZ31DRAFT_65375 [Schizophyllum fasciatum]